MSSDNPAQANEATTAANEAEAKKRQRTNKPAPAGKKTFTLVVKHGSYIGLPQECPDAEGRTTMTHTRDGEGTPNAGFSYDKDHPAQPGEMVVGIDEKRATKMLLSGCFQTVGEYEADKMRAGSTVNRMDDPSKAEQNRALARLHADE